VILFLRGSLEEISMLIHDDIYAWKGFGGLLDLAAGQCRLRIFDLGRDAVPRKEKVMPIKPMVVVVSDLPGHLAHMKSVSVRSCTSHIATCVVRDFNIPPQRMLYVEYYPASTYGDRNQHHIPAKLDGVEFQWHDRKALHPQWRPLAAPLFEEVMTLIRQTE
jgi:hypothetical protein